MKTIQITESYVVLMTFIVLVLNHDYCHCVVIFVKLDNRISDVANCR